MHKGQKARIRVLFQRIFNHSRIDRFAPAMIDRHGNTAATFDILPHPFAKHAVTTNDHFLTRLYQVDKTGFHPG